MRFRVAVKTNNPSLIDGLRKKLTRIDFFIIENDILTIDFKDFDSIWYDNKNELSKEVKELMIEFGIPYVKVEKKFKYLFTVNDSRKYNGLTIDFKNDIYLYMGKHNFDLYLTLISLTSFIENKEKREIGHSLRVAYLTKKFCQKLGIDKETTSKIYMASLFHDIGKIAIPNYILTKNAKLSDHEYDLMKRHSQVGALLLNNADIGDIVKHHHERVDGKGYPDKLSGNKISLGARILAIVDSYDAMTSVRCYNPDPKNINDALNEIISCSIEEEFGGKGCQFDSNLAEKFCEFIKNN